MFDKFVTARIAGTGAEYHEFPRTPATSFQIILKGRQQQAKMRAVVTNTISMQTGTEQCTGTMSQFPRSLQTYRRWITDDCSPMVRIAGMGDHVNN